LPAYWGSPLVELSGLFALLEAIEMSSISAIFIGRAAFKLSRYCLVGALYSFTNTTCRKIELTERLNMVSFSQSQRLVRVTRVVTWFVV
jgi:hypothetical protein